MKTISHIIIFLLLMAPCLGAQESSTAVNPGGQESLETEPRRIATTVFQITNPTSKKQEFLSSVNLPKGWTLITNQPSFALAPNESDARLVSFLVPQRTLAGQYELKYFVKTRETPSIKGSSTLNVVVLPVRKLIVELLEAPQFVIAGEDYRASFAVFNESNIENEVSIQIHSGENLPFATDTKKLKLAPGESKTIGVTVRTDADMSKMLKHRLHFSAQTFEDREINAQATSYVDIFPKTTGVVERFHKIPTATTFRYVTQRNDEDQGGFQVEASGAGTLGKDRKEEVSFLFRGPDVQEKSIFGWHDEYRLTFRTKHAELRLGDQVYSVSPLIEKYGYGRGIEGRLMLDRLGAGAYHLETRWLERKEEHTAGYLDYLVVDTFQMGLNYLHRATEGEDEDIASLECRLGPFGNTNLELEYALGEQNRENGNAYRLGVSSHWNWISYVSRFVHAEPGAPAYNRNQNFASAALVIRAKHNLKLQASLEREKHNLDLNPTLHSAPLEKSCQLGVDYKLKTGTSLYVYYRDRNRQDRFTDPKFRYQEETVLFGVRQSFKKMGFNVSVESGERKDELRDESAELDRYKAYAYFRPSPRLSSGGYVYYDDSGDFAQEQERCITVGLSSSLTIANNTLFSLNFQTSGYENSASGDRHVLELSLSHRFRDHSEIRLRARRTSYMDAEGGYGSAVKIEYTIPFGLPTARKKDFGRIKGHVYDQENSHPISDVILKINGTTAVTDKHGKFSFPSVKPGGHYLSVSTARIGLDRIAAQKIPMEVSIQGGEETRIEVGITRAASLSGQVLVYRLTNSQANSHNNHSSDGANGNHHVIGEGNDNGFLNNGNGHNVIADGNNNGSYDNGELTLVKAQSLATVLVELRNSSEVLRCLTDREGRFGFEEIRPGEWTLEIYQNNLPQYHHFERDTFNFVLKPGQREEVLVRVLPRMRPIQIIEEGGIILEKKGK
jgi:hypothetical protein